jgi:NADH dehydrogenase FAD-containing subunit
VIVGAGIGARLVAKELSSIRHRIDITVIQPNDFAEMPFTGPLTLSYPEHYSKCVTGQTIPNVNTVFGIGTSVRDGVLTVSEYM